MATLTARLDADVFDELRDANHLGCANVAEAINEAITLCLPSAIVSLDAEATAVTIAVKDDDLLRSLVSLGIDEYMSRYAPRNEPPAPAQAEESGGFKQLIETVIAPLVAKPA
ncbi:MAG: hypothetical protein JOZ84_08395 [Methylobacteriaceae bacterium]|nr:hypothetical protein [Methylobacteriaceae bacterium]